MNPTQLKLRARVLGALFLVALIVKLISAGYLLYLTEVSLGKQQPFSIFTAEYPVSFDTADPMENYVTEGQYYRWNGREKVYAGRMPHYMLAYYLFRQAVDKQSAYVCVAVVQILVESLAIVCLALLAGALFRSASAFYWVYLLQLVSLNSTWYSFWVDPLSLSISAMVIALYALHRFFERPGVLRLALAGVAFACMVLFRPYMGMFYPVVFLLLLRSADGSGRVERWRKAGARAVVFFLPLALAVAPWVVRNYRVYQRFIPMQVNLTAGENYSPAYFAYRRFVHAWGESHQAWDKRSAGCYFEPQYDFGCDFVFPDYAFTSQYSMQDLEETRDEFVLAQRSGSPVLDARVAERFDRMTRSFVEERPFRYYVISPLNLARKFIFHSGSYYLPIGRSLPGYTVWHGLLKLSQSALYYFALILGLAGLVWLAIADRANALLVCVPIFLVVFFAILLRHVEFQYFAHAYPVLILGTAWASGWARRLRRT